MKDKVSKVITEVVHETRDEKPNSRVTKAHVERMIDAMRYAQQDDVLIPVRLGYLSFAIAGVLKEIGYPIWYDIISKRMWDNYSVKSE